ncbi:MAG: thioredoxin domain-containing protein [Bacteriovoracaceae bacterium]
MNKKTLTLNGFTIPHSVYVLISVAMVAVGIYLTKHFYLVNFPTGIGSESSLCSGDGFWGCNKATESALGHIFYVPTSFFGIVIGLLGIFGAVFPSVQMEKTNKFFIILNAIGCLGLLAFSIIGLGGLCQFCAVYYLLSFIAAFLFFKYSALSPIPDLKITAIYGALVLLPGVFMYNYFIDQMERKSSLSGQYVDQFEQLKSMGEPNYISPYKINQATENWEDAPVRIAVFSDFQCPFCQKVADQMPGLLRGYENKINVAYYFYPLDNACNPNITRSFHEYACKAAYLSACDQDKFVEVHDVIFERQEKLSHSNLEKWAKEFGLSGCFDNPEIQDVVRQTLNVGDQYNLKSTPTLVINGKKIEGSIPTPYLRAIIESLLEKSE